MTEKSATPTLKASNREVIGKKVKHLRKEGKIPAVLYGNKKESHSIFLPELEFQKLFQEVGHTTLLNVSIEGGRAVKALIHEVQKNPLNNRILHVDFYQVNLKEKLHTAIPLEFIGQSEAVDLLGGVLLEIKDEVEVECLPDDLIQHIEVDISAQKTFDDAIRVKDLPTHEGVTILNDEEEMIAAISEPRSLAELEALDEPIEPVAETEVESETKSGTDGEEATEDGAEMKDKEDKK